MKNRAFTLIELLVVVLIIGILVAIALPQYERAIMKVKSAELFSIINKVYKAEKEYYLANGTYTAQLDELDTGYPFVFDSVANNYKIKGLYCVASHIDEITAYISCQTTGTKYYHQYALFLKLKTRYCYANKKAKFLCQALAGNEGTEYQTGSWRYVF